MQAMLKISPVLATESVYFQTQKYLEDINKYFCMRIQKKKHTKNKVNGSQASMKRIPFSFIPDCLHGFFFQSAFYASIVNSTHFRKNAKKCTRLLLICLISIFYSKCKSRNTSILALKTEAILNKGRNNALLFYVKSVF